MKVWHLFFLLLLCLDVSVEAQSVTVKGYAYESGNRGYLAGVSVVATDESGQVLAETKSDYDGKYELEVPMISEVIITATKSLFNEYVHIIDPSSRKPSEVVFLKTSMKRSPGYIFEITLAEKRENDNTPVDAIRGAWIEAYNNTTQKEVLSLKDHVHPDFKVDLKKGNHYTILIRKEGYLAKRLEAFVDVKGCILCFEGVGTVEPGVSDNLTEGNIMGTLLANVEMERLYTGKKIEVENIYYDLGKWNIKDEAREALGKIATFLKDNPRLNVELGSHTDVRGSTETNRVLSQKRARSAARYLTNVGDIRRGRISYKGYGESQIVNKCKEGVECTELEHEKNRRTELKILGLDADQYIPKSLAQMKKEEQLEKMILALSDEEQIRIEEGAELPEDLQKKISEEESVTSVSKELREFQDIPGGEYKAKVEKQVVVFEGTDIPKANVVLEDKNKSVINKQRSAEVGLSDSYTLPEESVSADVSEAELNVPSEPEVIMDKVEPAEKLKQLDEEVEIKEKSVSQSVDDLENEATKMIEEESKNLENIKVEREKIEQKSIEVEADKVIEINKKFAQKEVALVEATPKKVTDLIEAKEMNVEDVEKEALSMIKEESSILEAKKKAIVAEKKKAVNAELKANEEPIEVTKEMPITDESPKLAWLDGHKIVIHYGNIELDNTHEIYERHVEVDMYSPQKGYYYYMVGSFDTKVEAEKYLNSYLSQLYPNAYVVEFDEGRKLRK